MRRVEGTEDTVIFSITRVGWHKNCECGDAAACGRSGSVDGIVHAPCFAVMNIASSGKLVLNSRQWHMLRNFIVF